MLGERHVLMGGDSGDSGGGGGSDRNTNTVEVVEKSFQSPGTTGREIDRNTEFFRGKSRAEQKASEQFANFAGGFLGGAVGGPAGSLAGGRFLKNLASKSKTFRVDANGNRIEGEAPDSGGGSETGNINQGGFSSLSSLARGGNQSNSSGNGGQVSAASNAIQAALGFQEDAAEAGTISLREGRDAALGNIQPFADAGRSALESQMALLGLSGDESQQTALQGFSNSPEAQFAQQEEERAITRNALALGDAGGGRVKDQLAARGSQRFATRLDTRLAQLSGISGQGQQAASGEANINQNSAANLSNLFLGTGENQASAVLGQQVANSAAQSEANRIRAAEQAQKSQQDAARNSQLFGLAASVAKPFISSFF